jgi:uncharacterized tellurite resistance protein B-like protein
MSILGFLGFGKPEPADSARVSSSSDVGTIRKIVSQLENLDPVYARQVAAFAFILSRVAHADLEISEEEMREMERVVMVWGRLPEEQAVLVVQIAKHQNILFGGTDNFIVTRELNKTATPEQKTELLHCLFAVSASDDSISVIEENTIAKIAKELRISHEELMAILSEYRDKRAVMKDLPR